MKLSHWLGAAIVGGAAGAAAYIFGGKSAGGQKATTVIQTNIVDKPSTSGKVLATLPAKSTVLITTTMQDSKGAAFGTPGANPSLDPRDPGVWWYGVQTTNGKTKGFASAQFLNVA